MLTTRASFHAAPECYDTFSTPNCKTYNSAQSIAELLPIIATGAIPANFMRVGTTMLSSAHGEQSAPIFTKIIVHPAYGCFVSTARCPRAGRRLQPLGKVRVPESQKPRISGLMFAAIICAALGGCAQDFDFDEDYGAKPVSNSATPKRTARAKPKIDNALLETPAAPDCGAPQTAKRPAQPQSATASAELTTQSLPDGASQDANADLATRIKLEYERECYRQAEARVRDRLKQLQASTSQTAKAVKGPAP